MKVKNFMLLFAVSAIAMTASAQNADEPQGVPFNGIVCDQAGEPVKNVKVYVKSAKLYTYSDRKGRFGLTNVGPTDTLHLRVKKLNYDIPVEGRRSIKIWLADQPIYKAVEDQELVDIGNRFVKRREFTGVSNAISGDELRRSGQNNLWTALQGRIPGLVIETDNFGEAEITMRGKNSFVAPSTPLFIVDGVVVDSLDFINLYDVDYVEVLKDATIYGSRGANGVIIVHTKK